MMDYKPEFPDEDAADNGPSRYGGRLRSPMR